VGYLHIPQREIPQMALSDVTLKAKTHKDESGNVRKAPYKLYDEMGLYVQVTASGGDDIVRRFPASEWMERCMKAIPESDPGFIMAMIEISRGGDVKILP
jgi:UDP-N-acetyl-D-mannosaminuronic acid transferase (WecB/TagA/CpsF family)